MEASEAWPLESSRMNLTPGGSDDFSVYHVGDFPTQVQNTGQRPEEIGVKQQC